ncbi:MAG TPA: hypothetical protein VNC61_16295 [Acidimicrobiales bacterium]|nr:hypothetical protein [Acidimicrobiales bacterium]
MTSLILSERHGGTETPDYRVHAQQLPGGLDILVAPTGADSAMALDHELGISTSKIAPSDCDLLADCGRLLPGATGQEKMINRADKVLLLVRPEVAAVAHARWAVLKIREFSPSRLAIVVTGPGEFKPMEVAEELDVNLMGVVPFDSRAALMACGAPGTAKEFIRSKLVAFAREIVGALIQADRHLPTSDGPEVPTLPRHNADTLAPIRDGEVQMGNPALLKAVAQEQSRAALR